MEAFGRQDASSSQAPVREPAIRAPWPVVVLVAAILLLFALQAATLPVSVAAQKFGFSADRLAAGRWGGLVTALFVHAGWTHAILNAGAALAFGSPVARMLGVRPTGALIFFGFYLVCGALASLTHAAVAPQALLIGASGAVAGLMGAASRMAPGGPPGRLAPLLAPPVLGTAVGWVAVNLMIGVAGLDLGTAGAPVAWQAHLGGYAAGLLLAPVARALSGRG